MEKLVLIDGNSIANRAFYGIMGSKLLMTKDGKYTNAVYGFLAILFKVLEDVKPDYIAVAFDLKAPTARHKMYEGYKATRKGMPEELAEQMPIIKDVLRAMNIDIIEKEGYEADDVLGTLSCYGEKQGLEVTILSGDRDTFQLATDKVTIRIPHTKAGKTETDLYDRAKIKEVYGLEPKQLIEVKGLQGDTSDNIPGVPGIGEKTALKLIQEYGSIEGIYEKLESGETSIKGKQKENLENNKELAFLSKTLGTINLEVPIEDTLENLKAEEWNKPEVLRMFKELNFKRYIERFQLESADFQNDIGLQKEEKKQLDYKIEEKDLSEISEIVKKQKQMIFYFGTKKQENVEQIIQEKIINISVYNPEENIVYYKNLEADVYKQIELKTEKEETQNKMQQLKEVLEDEEIQKIGIHLSRDYILLKQEGITLKGINFDAKIAAYVLNPTDNKLAIENIAEQYLEISCEEILGKDEPKKPEQINLFDSMGITDESDNINKEKAEKEKNRSALYVYIIWRLSEVMMPKIKEIGALELFQNIEIPTITVLANMQWNGMHADEEELNQFGKELKENLEKKTKIIYEMAGEEFNINSTKQLGEILFEKMKLPVIKKTKNGYSTDVDVLEKLRSEDPIIGQILEYRQYMKLNSTYVEGLKPYINPKDKRIHSFFHQTITATGRISSTEPNLQNIPTRFELGKQVRKIFKPEEGKVYIDADYSQIELRVLAHISEDEHMIQAFQNGEDIHKQAASKVFKTPIEEVTKEQRSNAKAVNFGIVYGISDFGLAEQLGISRKLAKTYIDEYLEQYSGIKNFMNNITEQAKEKGYVETLFHRRRYIPELKSKNYMVRQFGARAAMNTPIQGTAADIMKMAMISVQKQLEENKLKSKIVLQVHDEMMIEAPKEEAEQVKIIIKECMENVITLKVPLEVDISEAQSWYDCK